MKTWGSAAAVIAAIRDEAAAEIERLQHESTTRMDALRAAARPAPSAEADARLGAVRRRAAEQDRDEDWQDAMAAVADRDTWILAVAEQARRAAGSLASNPAKLTVLAREAVASLPADACEVVVPEGATAAHDPAWSAALEAATGKRISVVGGAIAGCIARTVDHRVAFDNTVEARDLRCRTAWRAALARLYDAATAAPAESATVRATAAAEGAGS
jgi:vacuolar-type H+-ATPase subunit E/Vma4